MIQDVLLHPRWSLRDPATGSLALVAAHGWSSVVIGTWESAEQAVQGGQGLGVSGEPEILERSSLLEEVINHGVGGVIDAPSGIGWAAATRLTEANHDRPTALVATDPAERGNKGGLVSVLRRTGLSESPSSDFIPWERWDILDKAWLPFLGDDPWIGYDPGQQLWTVVAGDSPIVIQGRHDARTLVQPRRNGHPRHIPGDPRDLHSASIQG